MGWGAGDNKISLLRSSIKSIGHIPSIVFWSPPPSIILDGEPETIKVVCCILLFSGWDYEVLGKDFNSIGSSRVYFEV